jgi:predicted porin
LGRRTVPFYDFAVTYDPMAISSRYSIGAQDPFMGAARADNSVKYMGTFGGLSVTGLYSFNYNNQEVPGNFTNGREYSLGANYSGGSFSIGAVYDQINQSAATALQTNSLTQRAAVAGTPTATPSFTRATVMRTRSTVPACLGPQRLTLRRTSLGQVLAIR